MKKWRKRLLSYFRIAVSIALIGWLVYMIDAEQLVTRLAGANFIYLGIMFVVANIGRVLMATKWNLLLRAKHIRVSWIDAISVYYRASFWGMIFLPTVGTDAMRILEVSQKTRRSEDIISSVVIERVLGIVAVALVGMVSLTLFIEQIGSDGWNILIRVALLLAGVATIFMFSMNKRWWGRLHTWLESSRWRMLDGLSKILQSYQDYAQHRTTLFVFLLLSIVEQFSAVITAFLISRTLQLDIPFLAFLMFVPIIMMIVRLPISFDGIGVREGLYVSLFGLIGVAQTEAFLVGLLSSVLWRFAIIPVTGYFFLISGLKTRQVEVNAQTVALKE
ncbi:MAG: YbhN family protein [Chloroflexaceae bacterium]